MNEKLRIIVYNPSFSYIKEMNNYEIRFSPVSSCPSLDGFDIAIVMGGSINLCFSDERDQKEEAIKREREIFNALEKGKIVCVLSGYRFDVLIRRIIGRLNISAHGFEETRADIQVNRSQFMYFLRKFGAVDHYFTGKMDDTICSIAISAEKRTINLVVGFTMRFGNGSLVFLPCHLSYEQLNNPEYLEDLINTLSETLAKYFVSVCYRPPEWINEFNFPIELLIREELKKLQEEMDERMNSLAKYSELKRILWFRNRELEEAVRGFFEKIGIETKRDEIYEEDFWILEQGEEKVIVEVKGKDKNLTRPDISKLDEHRGAREKPDDFPALLIVNSFNKATSFKEKDQEISPNEIKKAVRTSVLVMRTLDLCRAYSLIERKKFKASELLQLLKTETGWLKVTDEGYETVKQ